MPRIARLVLPGRAHHVTQRGADDQDIFFDDNDRRTYLQLLYEQAGHFGLKIDAYCLMPGHVHLVATPRKANSLAQAVGMTHLLYSRHLNSIYEMDGRIWQGRFASCALDRAHSQAAAVYVERSPVRAGIVRCPWRYRWSSAAAHCGGTDRWGLLNLDAWARLMPAGQPDAWKALLTKPLDDELLRKIRIWTSRGRPLGGKAFIGNLERKLGRRLHPLPVGRPTGNTARLQMEKAKALLRSKNKSKSKKRRRR